MITRLDATLESIQRATIATAVLVPTPGVALETYIPAYLADALEPQSGQRVTLHTRVLLEAQGQGTSFIPRLIAFGSAEERAFFETFTSVKGLGAKKALRALAMPPSEIAALIVAKDAKALTKLPEIGKRLAETMIAELSGKIERFAGEAIIAAGTPARSAVEPSLPAGPASEAVAALMALGEQRPDAVRNVESALASIGADADTDTIVQAVFGAAR